MEEHEFGDELAKLFTVQDGVIVRTVFDAVDFNEKALDLMEGLLKGRVERKREARAKEAKAALYRSMDQLLDDQAQRRVTRPRTWCDAECTLHQFHGPDGTPTDWDGIAVPVNQPYRHSKEN